jgi:carbon storage regulator
MLVLTRKVGEEIIIDGHIRITITAVNGERVKVGITAPRDVAVNRGEVAARVVAEEAELEVTLS